MLNKTKSAWCDDGIKKFQLPYDDYVKLIDTYIQKFNYQNKLYSYKGHNYIIIFDNGHHKPSDGLYFCGYVENVPDDMTYVPHGEFTGGFDTFTGFDCAHTFDFYGTKNVECSNENRTFKTEEFVHLECQKIIDKL